MSIYTKPYAERDGSVFQTYGDVTIEFRDASHKYWIHHDGRRIPAVSVTSALKVLDRPALLRWAEACGAEGAAFLASQGELKDVAPEQAIDIVRIHELGMKAKRDAGANRGTIVHRVLELWGSEEEVPSVDQFPADVAGYVQGLCRWLLAARPKATTVERLVASLTHTYAGRLDMRAEIDGRDCLVDLKTSPSGRIYPEAHLQAQAYAMASTECGMPSPERLLIVAVGADGSYTEADCEATPGGWLSVLAVYRTMLRLRADMKARAA